MAGGNDLLSGFGADATRAGGESGGIDMLVMSPGGGGQGAGQVNEYLVGELQH